MNSWLSIGLLVVLFAAMYFFMIRPQKKKEKKINEMRDNLQAGDEIITIGGFVGKVVRTKEDTVVIQLGADKQKVEMMRWAISEVTSKTSKASKEDTESPKPKRLKKATDDKAESEEKAPEKATEESKSEDSKDE